MTATTLPNVGVQYKWALGEDGWNAGMDSNLLAFDSLVQCNIISAASTTPPVSPTLGDKYIPYTEASDDWSSLVGKVVVYNGTGWTSFTPQEGWLVYDNNTNGYIKYTGSAWVADPFGDRAYTDASVNSINNPSTVITRDAKFGNHVALGSSITFCPYKGNITNGSQAIQSVAESELPTNRGNVSDSVMWEMSSNTINIFTGVSLHQGVTGSLQPTQQWRTGAKMQFLASLALHNVIPTTENFVYRIGLANVANSDLWSADPWVGTGSGIGNGYTGCAALFIADNTSAYWQCKSGQKTNTETTVTTVPIVLREYAVFHVTVTTTGAVEFRINGTLVATHSGSGVIPNGAFLGEGVGVRNLAATTTAKKGFYLDQFAFKFSLPSSRTGFSFT